MSRKIDRVVSTDRFVSDAVELRAQDRLVIYVGGHARGVSIIEGRDGIVKLHVKPCHTECCDGLAIAGTSRCEACRDVFRDYVDIEDTWRNNR